MPDSDILSELVRLLAKTPENTLTASPMSRRTLAATIAEIRRLRNTVATLARQHDDNERDQVIRE